MKNKINLLLIATALIGSVSCKKTVEIDPPTTSITTQEVFKDSLNATSAIAGVYSSIGIGGLNFMRGSLTISPGESADELAPYTPSQDFYYANNLLSSSGDPNLWNSAYTYIYQANAIIDGVQASTGISPVTKVRFMSEAKFLRSLFYFYLVNLYGDVPYVTTIDYHTNAIARKTSKAVIYTQLISDLKEAQASLPADYGLSVGGRTRANKWAATALLARIYLYTGDWANASIQAGLLIDNSSLFQLNPDLNAIFLNSASGNKEAILQWDLNVNAGSYNATAEGQTIIPNTPPNNAPNYYINPQLLNAFEPGDKRKVAWLDSTIYGSPATTFYYPYKYKIGQSQTTVNATPTELTTVLRLAEQFLIRAEAKAENSDVPGAINDLNAIRQRAGLPNLSSSLNRDQVLAAVAQERRIELFSEWGHRWFDLKRTGKIDEVMRIATPLKGQGTTWKSFQQLYPIPNFELQNDPYLTNTPGY